MKAKTCFRCGLLTKRLLLLLHFQAQLPKGEVEINPDLVNESAYDLGWILVLQPFQFDMENLLEPDEYVEYLSEI